MCYPKFVVRQEEDLHASTHFSSSSVHGKADLHVAGSSCSILSGFGSLDSLTLTSNQSAWVDLLEHLATGEDDATADDPESSPAEIYNCNIGYEQFEDVCGAAYNAYNGSPPSLVCPHCDSNELSGDSSVEEDEHFSARRSSRFSSSAHFSDSSVDCLTCSVRFAELACEPVWIDDALSRIRGAALDVMETQQAASVLSSRVYEGGIEERQQRRHEVDTEFSAIPPKAAAVEPSDSRAHVSRRRLVAGVARWSTCFQAKSKGKMSCQTAINEKATTANLSGHGGRSRLDASNTAPIASSDERHETSGISLKGPMSLTPWISRWVKSASV